MKVKIKVQNCAKNKSKKMVVYSALVFLIDNTLECIISFTEEPGVVPNSTLKGDDASGLGSG